MRCVRFLLLLIAVSTTAIVSLSGAQVKSPARVESCGPNDVVPWGPRPVGDAGSEMLTAAARATVVARLEAVEALMRKPYAAPRGFAVNPVFSFHEIKNRTQLY